MQEDLAGVAKHKENIQTPAASRLQEDDTSGAAKAQRTS